MKNNILVNFINDLMTHYAIRYKDNDYNKKLLAVCYITLLKNYKLGQLNIQTDIVMIMKSFITLLKIGKANIGSLQNNS